MTPRTLDLETEKTRLREALALAGIHLSVCAGWFVDLNAPPQHDKANEWAMKAKADASMELNDD